MTQHTRHVVRSDLRLDAAFESRLAREPDIKVHIVPSQSDEEAGWALLREAHVFVTPSAKDELPKRLFVNADFLARCPNLLSATVASAGYDIIDVAACTRAGVAVCNQAGANADSVAEMAIGLLLDVAHRISECDRRLRAERGFPREDVMGREIRGKTIGLIGFGHTGSRVAALARAFGMQVLAHDPYLSNDSIAAQGATAVSLHQLLERADAVSVHCPRNQETLDMLDAAAFARMKRGAMFVTTARGGIHDEAALADALASGHLAGAGLDVWEPEPPPLDHQLLKMPNVVATYHTAGVTHEARRNIAGMAAEQIVGLLKGERPPRLVNPESL